MFVAALCLNLGGCNTTKQIVSYQAYSKPDAREVITVKPELLDVKPLSDRPPATDYPSLHQRGIIIATDLIRDRGQLIQLVGAVKQREHSEAQIVAAEKARAAEVDALIIQLNENEAKRAKPWFKRLFSK